MARKVETAPMNVVQVSCTKIKLNQLQTWGLLRISRGKIPVGNWIPPEYRDMESLGLVERRPENSPTPAQIAQSKNDRINLRAKAIGLMRRADSTDQEKDRGLALDAFDEWKMYKIPGKDLIWALTFEGETLLKTGRVEVVKRGAK